MEFGIDMYTQVNLKKYTLNQFLSVQSLSHVRLFVTHVDCSTPSFPVHRQLLELAHTDAHHAGDAIQPSHHSAIFKEVYFKSAQFSTLNIKKQIA